MSRSNKILAITLSLGLAISPISSFSQEYTGTDTLPLNQTQQTGAAAGSSTAASTEGTLGLSTLPLVGFGAALAAIVVVAVTESNTESNKHIIIIENCDILGCYTAPPTTTTTTSTSTGTGTSN